MQIEIWSKIYEDILQIDEDIQQIDKDILRENVEGIIIIDGIQMTAKQSIDWI